MLLGTTKEKAKKFFKKDLNILKDKINSLREYADDWEFEECKNGKAFSIRMYDEDGDFRGYY